MVHSTGQFFANHFGELTTLGENTSCVDDFAFKVVQGGRWRGGEVADLEACWGNTFTERNLGSGGDSDNPR